MYCEQLEIYNEYRIKGHNAEAAVSLRHEGIIKKPDRVAYNKGSDVLNMSVKSARFTLMSGNLCQAQTFDGIIAEYVENVASEVFVYVTKDFMAYYMSLDEFVEFLKNFGRLSRESSRHGGRYKVQGKFESQKMLRWLEERATA